MTPRRTSTNALSFLSRLNSGANINETCDSDVSFPDESAFSVVSDEDFFTLRNIFNVRHHSFGEVMGEFDLGNPLSLSATDIRSHLQGLCQATSAPSPFYIPHAQEDTQSPIAKSPAAMFLGSTEMNPAHIHNSKFSLGTPQQQYHVPGYILGPTIGIGGQSVIKKAESSNGGGTVAVKIVHITGGKISDPFSISPCCNRKQRRQLRREAQIWSSLSHEHILPLFSSTFTSNEYSDSLDGEHDNTVFFVTLFCPAGSLLDILQRSGGSSLKIPQDDAGMMFRQVARGLRYLHDEKRLVHGDIKLENVLVDETGTCKIADFGMSSWLDVHDDPTESSAHEESDSERRERSEHDEAERSEWPSRRGRDEKLRQKGVRQPHRRTFNGISRHASMVEAMPSSGSIQSSHSLREPRRRRIRSKYKDVPRGSLPYASPEILYRPTQSSRYSDIPACQTTKCGTHPAQDIWALGVLLFILLSGKFPFHNSYEPRLVEQIIRGHYKMPEGIGQIAEEILEGCLRREYVQRWNIAMVDENAWGVGWGERPCSTPGSNVTPSRTSQHQDLHKSSAGPSRQSTHDVQATSTCEIITEAIQNRVSLLQSTRPSSFPREGHQKPVEVETQEDEDDDHIYATRGRRKGFYHSQAGSRSNIYHPGAPPNNDTNSSRSRSTSRPPPAMEAHTHHPRAVALDPITTRVSVSVERHDGSSKSAGAHSLQHQFLAGLHISPSNSNSHDHDHNADPEEDEDEEYTARYRSTVPGRIVGRSTASRFSSNSPSNSRSNSHSQSQSNSRSRSRAPTEISPFTPPDREPIFTYSYHHHHHNSLNGYRASKFELGLEQHPERT